MVARSQVGGDQLNLLARGWLLIEDGVWVPYGNPTSMGGAQPGGLSALLVALPLALWRDHRAASALVLLTHLAAYLILDRTLRRALTPWGRLLFAVLYWLNPWRLYFSAFLWNPNWLFLPGAVHLWSAWEQRERARFWPSFLHVLALGLAFQVHASVVLLGIASAVLLVRRTMRLHWAGAAAAAALSAAALIPWALAAQADAGSLPVQKGFLGRGLVLVLPLLKGLLYWFRYASLAVGKRVIDLDFAASLGAGGDRVVEPLAEGFLAALGVTLLVPLLANARLWRRPRRWLRRRPAASARGWVRAYAAACFAAAAVTFALSPTTIMMWQGFLVLHAAVLPPLFWGEVLARTRRWGGSRCARLGCGPRPRSFAQCSSRSAAPTTAAAATPPSASPSATTTRCSTPSASTAAARCRSSRAPGGPTSSPSPAARCAAQGAPSAAKAGCRPNAPGPTAAAARTAAP